MTVRYKLGCELSYEVKSPTTFIFNLEIAKLVRHRDLVEKLTISPDLPRRAYIVPDVRNRYFSINADVGPLDIRYEAEVTLEVFRTDPASVNETPLTEMPLDIMPFLLPSRYVSSDRLAAFAEREFADLPKGHQRVTAICNWIYDKIDYQRGSSNEQTTADESLLSRRVSAVTSPISALLSVARWIYRLALSAVMPTVLSRPISTRSLRLILTVDGGCSTRRGKQTSMVWSESASAATRPKSPSPLRSANWRQDR
ncbi:hypothetical protein ACVIEM_006543 [Rhizobium leguminosarum]